MRREQLLVTAGLLLALAACTHGRPSPPRCTVPQSPRRVWLYDQRSTVSTVERGPDQSIYYTPRAGGERQQLFQCGQHYHCYVENQQKCPGDPSPPPGEAKCPAHPGVGDWIEVHTVYAAQVGTQCDSETLDCCRKEPFLVRAYQVRVTDSHATLPDPWSPLVIQWSGSTTGPDKTSNECKPAAQWSFTPECKLEVGRDVLEDLFHHPHEARALQTADRLSHDLTLVTPR